MTAPSHPLTRAVPLAGLVSVACVIALLASPSLRRQLQLSTSRQPEPYVNLYFADVAAARSCHATRGTTSLAVSVASHLTERRTLRYAVSVVGRAHRVEALRTGVIRTSPWRVATVRARLHVPSGGYTVHVLLPGRPEQLIVHCPANGGSR